jgi:hypothetical protein
MKFKARDRRSGCPIGYVTEKRSRRADMIGRWLITIGVLLVVAGLLWPWLGKLGLGRLPGDILIERADSRFYFPIVTCLGVSLVVSLILRLLNR